MSRQVHYLKIFCYEKIKKPKNILAYQNQHYIATCGLVNGLGLNILLKIDPKCHNNQKRFSTLFGLLKKKLTKVGTLISFLVRFFRLKSFLDGFVLRCLCSQMTLFLVVFVPRWHCAQLALFLVCFIPNLFCSQLNVPTFPVCFVPRCLCS